ncbi:MAG: helix-turn-helix domain-containing protein, partial [Dysgonomonas sp.]
MAKYNEKLVEKIIALVEEDAYTISQICDMLRISRKTFYEWKETKPEFRKALEDAEDRRDENLLFIA